LLDRESHPARFPADLPKFFIQFLTDPEDVVLDIFSGSNTTGYVAEQYQRRWLSMELERSYAALSAVRFMEEWPEHEIQSSLVSIEAGSRMRLKAPSLALFDKEPERLRATPPGTDAPGQAVFFVT
jgi:hypothetical protein